MGCKRCCGTSGCRRVRNSIHGTRKTSQKNWNHPMLAESTIVGNSYYLEKSYRYLRVHVIQGKNETLHSVKYFVQMHYVHIYLYIYVPISYIHIYILLYLYIYAYTFIYYINIYQYINTYIYIYNIYYIMFYIQLTVPLWHRKFFINYLQILNHISVSVCNSLKFVWVFTVISWFVEVLFFISKRYQVSTFHTHYYQSH